MASYDAARGCYVVRIVYDGPGLAGKTTNLREVCNFVSAKRRSELYTPAELKGRTMFFDWLEVDGPPQGPAQIKFQLITVPGQVQRNYRRRPLVEMADVVVFVCDCTPAQLPDTQRTFARLRASMKRRKTALPLVVQANKQDTKQALDPDRLRRRLRLDSDVPVVGAAAVDGRGVRETLVTAMRIGILALRDGEIGPLAATFANADALFDHALTFEDHAKDDEPIDAEELNIADRELDMPANEVAAHLAASSLDALEARARKAANRGQDSAPVEVDEHDRATPEVQARRGGRRERERSRGG
jgi:signal recognition particle receptor subunit beta